MQTDEPASNIDCASLNLMKISWEPKTFDTLYALSSFRTYCDESERLIQMAATDAERVDGPKWNPLTEADEGEYIEERRIARHVHDEILTPIFRYSCVTMLYAVVERELRRLCSTLKIEHSSAKLGYKDLKGGILEQITKWCQAYFELDLTLFPEFSQIRDLQKVRDCIVHCRGEVDESRDKQYLIAMTKRYPGFMAWEHDEIEIESDFILRLHREAWNFFLAVFAKLRWNVDRGFLVRTF